jgi:NAD(P)-dependent dehydrogenase (short-subunit alcohol dehydrogenase family)
MNGSTVLVTGGAGNVGRAVTRAFLEAGARVAVPFYKTDQQNALESLVADHGDRLLTFALDLTTERGSEAAVRDVVEWGGKLDAVVHMIGGYSGGLTVDRTPIEVWDRMIDLNLKSAYLIARASLPPMLEAQSGAFVFVSSRAARVARGGQAAYAVAKAGIITFAEALAEEFRDQGIRANVVIPGTVDTPANREAMPDADPGAWTHPSDIARLILFLASSEATAINGASVPVYGRG